MIATPRRLAFTCVLAGLGLLPAATRADEPVPAPAPWAWTRGAAELHCLSLCELDDLYERGVVHHAPQGRFTGAVITFTNMLTPEFAKRLADHFWVGKNIDADGYFINQWKRREALHSWLRIGPGYGDGKPAVIFEYPWHTPLFGPMRDEFREIAPGLFLGRMYRRRDCRFLGYNYLHLQPCCAPAAAGPCVERVGEATLAPPPHGP